jgi:hypothetical protein
VIYRQALLLSALAVAPAIHAETLYVIEQLVVNVNSAPDATGERVTTLKSGAPVEVLDRQGDQVHVQLSNGTAGWVRKSFLSAEVPLQQRLTERTGEAEKLKQDVARLEAELAAARSAKPTAPLASKPASESPAPAETNNTANDPSPGEPAYFMTPPDAPARPVWHWALGSFVVALGLGFALGWYVLDRRIRRKYGGLRIY